MKHYRFRLATVLRVRSLQEDLARVRLREAGAELAGADTVVAQRAQELHAAVSDTDGDALVFLAGQERRLRLAAALRDAEQARARAADRREEARGLWSAAARRVDALESLDARHRAQHEALVRAEEDRLADDVVTGRARRAR